eukprot:Hpha_TRINITY_DN15267_c0_g1::TRINITY_DN15267_c0_g1_i3::g.67807::m.67807
MRSKTDTIPQGELRGKVRALQRRRPDAMPKLAVDSNLRRLPSGEDEGVSFTALMTMLFSQQPSQARRAMHRVQRQLEQQAGREASRGSRASLSPGKLSKQELQEVKEIFGMYDADGNGEISRPEFRAIVGKLNIALSEVDQIFEICSDKSDTIKWEQFLEIMMETKMAIRDLDTSHRPDDMDGSWDDCSARPKLNKKEVKRHPVLRLTLPTGMAVDGNVRSLRMLKVRQRLQKVMPNCNIPLCYEHDDSQAGLDEASKSDEKEGDEEQMLFLQYLSRVDKRREIQKVS